MPSWQSWGCSQYSVSKLVDRLTYVIFNQEIKAAQEDANTGAEIELDKSQAVRLKHRNAPNALAIAAR